MNNFIIKCIESDLHLGKYKNIKTRFPPEPNGYLHIGHAKSICLNFDIAKNYHGKCNLRFDDTNPEKENIKYIKSIKYDIKWLGFKLSNNIYYTSNYFQEIYNFALELIYKNLAYVDQLSPEDIHNYRGTLKNCGINSPYRNRNIEENINLFKKMKNGYFKEGDVCLRAKIDMASSHIIMRDPVLYRIKFTKHHRTNREWCIYPMYDFAHCIADALEGISHSLCTMEFKNNRILYDWILSNISINAKPKQYEFSSLELEYTILSKRKLSLLIKNNIVEGWDDPRMPTISGLRRRGYTPNSICNFCKKVGVTKQNNTIELSMLEFCIREELNKCSIRVMAIIKPVLLIIESLPIGYKKILIVKNHPNNNNMGFHKVQFNREIYIDKSDFCEKYSNEYKKLTLNNRIRLRHACIIKISHIKKNTFGEITTIFCTHEYNINCNDNTKKKINVGVIHWVSAKDNVPVEFRIYDKLFCIPKPYIVSNFLKFINKKSLTIYDGFVEKSILFLKNYAKIFQFEREGYFCIDKFLSTKNKIVFNRTVTLKNKFNK
ncbi:MAG: glutamine--tRNA ligase/YqeY domain fusion protein [Enterobacterales bacterium]